MSGDQVLPLQGITTRLSACRAKATQLQALRDRACSERDKRIVEIKDLAARLDRLAKVGELFRMLLDRMVLGQIEKVTALVTEGLQVIGWKGLKLEAEVSYKYGKISVDFFFVRGDVRAPPMGAFGGGPSSVAGLILRMWVLMRLKRRAFLFLDESLLAVSQEYVDATSDFLREFAKKIGMDFLIVTHNPGFMEGASVAYYAGEEPVGLDTRLTLRRKV